MPLRSSREQWGSVIKTLHWLIFLAIAGLATVGVFARNGAAHRGLV